MNKYSEDQKLKLGKEYFHADATLKRGIRERTGLSDRTLRRYRDLYFASSGSFTEPSNEEKPVIQSEDTAQPEYDYSVLVDTHSAIVTDNVKTTSVQFSKGSPEYTEVVSLISSYDGSNPVWEKFFPKPIGKTIQEAFLKDFKIIGDTLMFRNRAIPIALARLLKDMLNLELPKPNLFNFLDKIYKNPSPFVFSTLFDFLTHTNTEITEEGMVIAYKAVNSNYTDIHSGTILNTVGTTVELPRNMVDAIPDNTCSHGLHVGSLAYATSFAKPDSRILQVMVHPEDFVTVPFDYSGDKARVCKYVILKDVTDELPTKYKIANSVTF